MLRRNFISILGSIPFLNLNKSHNPIESLQVGEEKIEVLQRTKDLVQFRKTKNGTTSWFVSKLNPEKGLWKNFLHREDGPAVEYADGTKKWFQNGNLHREDGPAVEYANGEKKWFKNNKLHRDDGPAVEYPDGTKHWFQNGKRHRDDGPAIERPDGTKKWFQNGNLHREDGPAVELPDGTMKAKSINPSNRVAKLPTT